MSKLYKNNSSGFPGVCYETKANKYRAYISVYGEKIRLGYFSNLNDAIRARVNAENLYKFDTARYGDDSRLIRFIIKEDDSRYPEAFYALIRAVFDYDGSCSFSTFAVDYIDNHLKEVEKHHHSHRKYLTRYNSMYFENKEIFNDWLNGNTMKQIAKKYNTSVYEIRKKILKSTNELKEVFTDDCVLHNS